MLVSCYDLFWRFYGYVYEESLTINRYLWYGRNVDILTPTFDIRNFNEIVGVEASFS